MNISAIIKFLDDYLIKNGLQSVTAVEANALLEKAKLLKDSNDRPGKPFRDLLRKGLIPHAYQLASSKHWVVPRLTNSTAKAKIVPYPKAKSGSAIEKTNTTEFHNLRFRIESARLAYRPHYVKYLLIAEAPPNAVERFFYYPDVKSGDHLFLGIIECLYPEVKTAYLNSGRAKALKLKILDRFQEDGFYLIDLSELPLSIEPLSEKHVEQLEHRARVLLNEGTKIIIIKSNIYDRCYTRLRAAFGENVVDAKIPFPSTGHQIEFQKKFTAALKRTGL